MEIPGDPEKGLLSMVFREDGRWEQRQQGQCKVTEGSRGPGLARGGVEAQEANWPRVMELDVKEPELNQAVGLEFPSLPVFPTAIFKCEASK